VTFLPIVFRELRVASRRRGTYWSRVLTAMAAIGAGVVVYLFNFDSAPHDLGQILFYTISVGALVYCLFTGIRSTADCLSEEKRDGTLGLLFLTDLKGYDVVGGKLVATSLNSFYGLTAIFPMLAIPLLMGGVTSGEFWRISLVLANTFLFSLAVGMFMSAVSKSARKAMAGTLVLLLLSSVGLGLLQLVPAVERSEHVQTVLKVLNPCYSFGEGIDAQYVKGWKYYWWSLGVIHGLAWIFLGLASVIVPRSWQDRSSAADGTGWRAAWREWAYGASAARAEFRRRLLNHNALYWLAGRDRLKPFYVWATLIGLAGLWGWGAHEFGNDWTFSFVFCSLVMNTVLKLWVTSEAGRRLGDDRKLGSLELILSTPLSVPDILRGQLLALRRQFLGPLLAVMFVEAALLVAVLRSSETDAASIANYLAGWAALTVMLLLDLAALSVVAMWVSLTTKNTNRTTGITVLRVLVLPWGATLGICLCAALFNLVSAQFEPGLKSMLAAWFLPGLAADLLFGLNAWRRLRLDFREVAALRFVPSRSRLGTWIKGGTRPAPAVSAADPGAA
jgi:ABC-type Na+ efflux pump permease subunit